MCYEDIVDAGRMAERSDTLRLPVLGDPTSRINAGARFVLDGFGLLVSPILIGTAPHTEIAVTYSKQTTVYWPNRGRNCIPRPTKVVDVRNFQAKEKRNPFALNSDIMVVSCL